MKPSQEETPDPEPLYSDAARAEVTRMEQPTTKRAVSTVVFENADAYSGNQLAAIDKAAREAMCETNRAAQLIVKCGTGATPRFSLVAKIVTAKSQELMVTLLVGATEPEIIASLHALQRSWEYSL